MMDERRFQRIVANHQWRAPRPLMRGEIGERLLRGFASRARRFQLAVEAWERVASPDWLPNAAVCGVERDVLVLSVRKAALLAELRIRAPRLSREIGKILSDVRSVRFELAGPHAAGKEETTSERD